MTAEQKLMVFEGMRQLRDGGHYAAVSFNTAYVRAWRDVDQPRPTLISWNEAARLIGRVDLVVNKRGGQRLHVDRIEPWQRRRAEYLRQVGRIEPE